MSKIIKLKSTADILGGSVFFADVNGFDPEYPENGDLLPNGMYIRLEGSDGSIAYISAYELDKSMEIISNLSVGKANQSDVDALQQLLEEKATDTELKLLESEVATKVSKTEFENVSNSVANKADIETVNNIASTVANKADKTTVDLLVDSITNKASTELVNSINDTVANKADKTTVDSLKADLAALESIVGSVTDANSIAAIQNQIAYLNSEINKRLTNDDIEPLKNSVLAAADGIEEINVQLEIIEANINKKASNTYVQSQINTVNTAISDISSKIDNKAEKADVVIKANKEDLDKITKKVSDLNSTVNTTLSELDANYQELVGNLHNKADKTYTENAINSLDSKLNQKANKIDVADSINRIETRVNNIENVCNNNISNISDDIENLECNVNNMFSELNSSVNLINRQVTSTNTQIDNIRQEMVEYEDYIRNEWVRVMTPEAYKRLAPIGDTFSDGSPNPYAKQANTIYMLVRYNKPIAVYIGDILIAKAEQKGSIGFAYSFPIIFQ